MNEQVYLPITRVQCRRDGTCGAQKSDAGLLQYNAGDIARPNDVSSPSHVHRADHVSYVGRRRWRVSASRYQHRLPQNGTHTSTVFAVLILDSLSPLSRLAAVSSVSEQFLNGTSAHNRPFQCRFVSLLIAAFICGLRVGDYLQQCCSTLCFDIVLFYSCLRRPSRGL